MVSQAGRLSVPSRFPPLGVAQEQRTTLWDREGTGATFPSPEICDGSRRFLGAQESMNMAQRGHRAEEAASSRRRQDTAGTSMGL